MNTHERHRWFDDWPGAEDPALRKLVADATSVVDQRAHQAAMMDTTLDMPAAAHIPGRHYTEEVLNRSTGEMETISLGHWVTVTELGELQGVGRNRVRAILRELDFLAVEGGGRYQRHRITRWAVDRGYGKRIERSAKVANPFDVISPAGRIWIEERWSAAVTAIQERDTPDTLHAKDALERFQASRKHKLKIEEAVCWLVDHFDTLTQEQMSEILDVSRQLVSRYLNTRSKQIRDAREGKCAALSDEVQGQGNVSFPLWFVEVDNTSPQHLEKRP